MIHSFVPFGLCQIANGAQLVLKLHAIALVSLSNFLQNVRMLGHFHAVHSQRLIINFNPRD